MIHVSRGKRALCGLSMLVLSCAVAVQAQVPAPEPYFGFRIGSDKKLVRYDKIVEYLQKVAGASDRVRFHNLGPTTQGNPFVMLEISSAENLKNLDHYQALERKLYFQNGAPTDAERDEILKTGKAVVLVTNNIHSTEIGSSQMVLELVYQLATDHSPRTQKILDNVILLLVPSLNPDGQIMVTDWYNKNLGTPYEASPMPWLYHPYVGHDNNRDMFLFSQKESVLAAQILWHDWFPSVWLDEHQMGSSGARIFTMPATDPINPNVDTLIYRLNTIYGQQQAAALEREGKTGIIYNATYTNFWQGAMAWAGWWHNQVGLLTEVASARIATPVTQQMADPSRPPAPPAAPEAERQRMAENPDAPLPPPRDITPRTEYPHPWLGGKWTLRDIVDYELIATTALLEAAADSRETLLRQIYSVNLHTIEAGTKGEIGGGRQKNYAVLIPVAGQHDANEVVELVDKLRIGGVEVYRATKDFQQDGHAYAAGTYVVPFNQVFARYAKDLLERQTYPEVRRAPNAPAEAPYDVSAWSLGLQFGVNTIFANTPLAKDVALEKVSETPKFTLAAEPAGKDWRFPYGGAASAIVVNRLLKEGAKVGLAKAPSGEAFVVTTARPEAWKKATAGFDVPPPQPAGAPRLSSQPLRVPRLGIYQSWTANMDEGWTRWVLEHYEFPYTVLHNADIKSGKLRMPRLGIYQSWTANMDEGWTRWVLDHYEFPYAVLHNADIKSGRLREKFDAIILPDQRERDIMEGQRGRNVLEQYRGGLGDDGWGALRQFLNDGGTLISLGEACNLLINRLPLPVKELKHSLNRDQHFAPGTIVRLQVDTAHPLGLGVAPDTFGFYINSPFFETTDGFSSQKVSVVARYPNTEARASGWLRGEDLMLGRAAVVTVETNPGKVVLFGIRPQHRAQSHATLPLLFNAIYWAAQGEASSEGTKRAR